MSQRKARPEQRVLTDFDRLLMKDPGCQDCGCLGWKPRPGGARLCDYCYRKHEPRPLEPARPEKREGEDG